MASAGKTANLNLNQWAGSDDVIRTDFNSDNAKIDAAVVAAKAEAQTGIQQAKTSAATAKSAADNAQSAANNAQYTANQGVNNAAAAQSTANTAKSNAATAQSTANSAVSAASNAQNAANAAAEKYVLGSYVGKGTTPCTVNLGFQPKVLMVVATGSNSQPCTILAFPGVGIQFSSTGSDLLNSANFELTAQGFIAKNEYHCNYLGKTNRYIAFR